MTETPAPPIPTLETPRLILRPLALDDAPAIQAIFPQWEIVRFLAAKVPWPYPDDGAFQYLKEIALPAMRDGKEWQWSIRPRTDPERLIGVVALMDTADDNRGFWLDLAWQGQGLMLEASSAATEFWFETLGRPVLRVGKAVANARSRGISERTGMRLVGIVERDYVSGRQPAEQWEITREEWRNRPR